MKVGRLLAVVLTPLLVMLANAGVASAAQAPAHTCSGPSISKPGILAPGTYGPLTVKGVCVIPGGNVTIEGGVKVTADSALLANFPGQPNVPEGDANVVVKGNVWVGFRGTIVLGCSPALGCVNTTADNVTGNVTGSGALGMLLHSDTIGGRITQKNGGGGTSCMPVGIFVALANPPFSAYEDDHVGGGITVTGLRTCWLGLTRDVVGQGVRIVDNASGDPDGAEILSNRVEGSLVCYANSMVWDSAEASFGHLFPRTAEPNTVEGSRMGQCRLASPSTPGGKPGPGPF